MIHVISLLGKAGHGKTTVANHLRDTYGARVVSLAAPLKKIAKAVMNFSDDQLYGTQEDKERVDPRYGMSARKFLQLLGTEGIRANLGGGVWLQALVFNIVEQHKAMGSPMSSVFVVDDARFVNEIEFIQNLKNRPESPKLFGTVVKLMCTDAPPAGNAAHASEAEIDQVRPDKIDAIVVSSRADGMDHLVQGFEAALDRPQLRNVRVALRDQRKAIAAREFDARRATEKAEGDARRATDASGHARSLTEAECAAAAAVVARAELA